jgi:hypothetical protein
MLRTLVKLALAALLINASWQLFSVYWAHFKFVDAVESTTQFRGDKSEEQIRNRILELAGEFELPISDENLTIQGSRIRTIVDSAYTRPVKLFPGYTYPWRFTVHTETRTLQ